MQKEETNELRVMIEREKAEREKKLKRKLQKKERKAEKKRKKRLKKEMKAKDQDKMAEFEKRELEIDRKVCQSLDSFLLLSYCFPIANFKGWIQLF